MKKIIQKIKNDTTVNRRSIHGDSHWERVAGFGRRIAANENVDATILFLFSHFHDCMRLSDGYDPEHGLRAAQYIESFPRALLGLKDKDVKRLMFACRFHTYEEPTSDLTVQACWDSDRLDLGRAGITPDPKRLFTRTAIDIACG